jgi:ribonuclease VapC
MIFCDASALIAIIAGEPDADRLADLLEADDRRLYSALSAWETVAGLSHRYGLGIDEARAHLERFLGAGQFRLVPIAAAELAIALDAYNRYGKGRHKAALNMGDCYAYACAKANRATLLFKGNDFAKTDIEAAAG